MNLRDLAYQKPNKSVLLIESVSTGLFVDSDVKAESLQGDSVYYQPFAAQGETREMIEEMLDRTLEDTDLVYSAVSRMTAQTDNWKDHNYVVVSY